MQTAFTSGYKIYVNLSRKEEIHLSNKIMVIQNKSKELHCFSKLIIDVTKANRNCQWIGTKRKISLWPSCFVLCSTNTSHKAVVYIVKQAQFHLWVHIWWRCWQCEIFFHNKKIYCLHCEHAWHTRCAWTKSFYSKLY